MRVAVLAGGRSSEHEVSLTSAAAVLDGLEAAGHEVEPIVIDRDGVWREEDPRAGDLGRGRPVALVPGGGHASLLRISEAGDESADIDVVFPMLHGPFGEDGTVQGLLECAGVPYVGAGVLASSLCMDKAVFKALMSAAGISQVRYRVVRDAAWQEDSDAVRRALGELGLPVFVKPACLGSSVGISKASSGEELGRALTAAFAHDAKVVVEAAVDALEVECSVIGNDEPLASEPGEIVIHGDWYDFDAKYEEGGMDLFVPARLPAEKLAHVRSLAIEVYRVIECAGLARIDFFVTNDTVLVSEVNTIPGFTPTSVFARLFEESGITYGELLNRLLDLALERHKRVAAYQH